MMSKIFVKVIISIALGVLIGVIVGGLEKNKIVDYYFGYDGPTTEISKELYEKEVRNSANEIKLFKKTHFNKDLAIYYGAIVGASLVLILLTPNLIKNKYV